jgi:hypothetical protein
MKRLALILALLSVPALAQIAVVPEVSNYPFGVLPGSTRQIVTNVTSGGTQCVAPAHQCLINWSVSATTGGASATFTDVNNTAVSSISGGLATITVNIGATSGACSLSGSIGSYVFASTATITVQAQSVDDNTKTGIFHFNVCANQGGTLANGEHGIVVAPAYKQAFQGQPITLQSWVTGCVDETGVWSITTQPGGGDAALADTTYRDTKATATVTGRYVYTYTANCNAGTATAIIYVSPNALPAYAATPNATQPQECYPDPALTGGDYEIGSGLAYSTISSTPAFSTITAGTIYRVHNTDLTGLSPSTYHEYFQIQKNGTQAQPIIFCGVPDSLGNLPIMSGNNATGQTGINPTNGTVGLSIISLWAATHYGFWQGGPVGPNYVSVTGIHFTGASPTNSYTQPNGSAACMCATDGTCVAGAPTSGPTCQWSTFTAAIRANSGTYLDFSGNELDGNPQGIFTENNAGSNAWSTYTKAVTVIGNNIHGFGYTNTGSHGMYLQSNYTLAEGNKIGPPGPGYYTSGYGPSMAKDRGSEGIFRYNYFNNNAGANELADRILDLVDNQDGPQYLVMDQYLSTPGQTNCNFSYWCLGDTAGPSVITAYFESFQKDFVYGNIIPWSDGGAIHYGGDHATVGMWNRNGTLYFYSNTVWQAQLLFDDGTAGGDPILAARFDVRNNIVWPYTGTTVPNFVRYVDEILSATTNLFETSSISITTPIVGGQTGMYTLGWANGGTTPWCGADGSGCLWPLTSPHMETHLPGLGAGNYLFTATQPFNSGTFTVPAGSAAISAGTTLTGLPAQNPVRFQYNLSTSALVARSPADRTLGAQSYSGGGGPSGGASGVTIQGATIQ